MKQFKNEITVVYSQVGEAPKMKLFKHLSAVNYFC